MAEIDDIEYSRDECISVVRDYYAFLTSMYLDDSVVVEPPEGGWPEITQESLKDLNKTDEVIALLRHLPYIERPDYPEGNQVLPGCYFAHWPDIARGAATRPPGALRLCSEPLDVDPEDIPPHVIGLTFGGRDHPDVLLDVEYGLIHWGECPEQLRFGFGEDPDWIPPVTADDADWAPDNEQVWRQNMPGWSVKDFFELAKNQYRKLKFIPSSPRRVTQLFDGCGEEQRRFATMLQNIYREHGWPDLERYDKGKCMAAVRKAMEDEYPDEFHHEDW